MDADKFLLRAQQWGSANAEVNIPLLSAESRAKLGVRNKDYSFFMFSLFAWKSAVVNSTFLTTYICGCFLSIPAKDVKQIQPNPEKAEQKYKAKTKQTETTENKNKKQMRPIPS